MLVKIITELLEWYQNATTCQLQNRNEKIHQQLSGMWAIQLSLWYVDYPALSLVCGLSSSQSGMLTIQLSVWYVDYPALTLVC
ncbi:hypothetical protein DPMN_082967 [Dreissena polymorpha]|uniref:Uncharacterized protein n=1 Tax=Dreissena polymorpha TaxID=45954 RepID=A0A9D3YBR7_DREPO|nr:hypothetical protein DPMN_082967 [Dreissena polymorpha]